MTPNSTSASLKFHKGVAQSQGFRATSLSIFNNVDPDVLLREIVQNSLDAARERDDVGHADVRFQFERVQLSDIPSIDVYQNRFRAALDTQRRLNSAQQAESITKGIQSELNKETTSVLWVMDNGVGLSPENMHRLLSDGQSNKGSAESTGSYGNGHMTMFPASNLRYLLYGGVFQKPEGNKPRRICAGHVILATHQLDEQNYGPDGFLVEKLNNDLFQPFDFYADSSIAPVIQHKLNEIERDFGTGALVGIVAFNSFNSQSASAEIVATIKRVVATHFTPAIYDDNLRVSITELDGNTHKVASGDLRSILDLGKSQKRRRHKTIGPSGQQAWQSLETLDSHYRHEVATDFGTVKLNFRTLSKTTDSAGGGGTNVHIFRNGMWISNKIPRFDRQQFAKSDPFSALILLDPNDAAKACDLIRASEGPRHVDVDEKRLGPLANEQRKRLREFLRQLLEKVKELAPEYSGSTFDPGFLTLDIAGDYGSKVKTPKSAAHSAAAFAAVEPKPSPGGKDYGRERGSSGKRNEFLRFGTQLKAKTTSIRKHDGIYVSILPEESTDRVELRLMQQDGSDDTCDAPAPAQFLELSHETRVNGSLIRRSAVKYDESNSIRGLDLGPIEQSLDEVQVFVPNRSSWNDAAIHVDLIKRRKRVNPATKSGKGSVDHE